MDDEQSNRALTAKNASNPDQACFEAYAIRGAKCVLEEVKATETVLPELLQEQALIYLTFALEIPEGWPVARELLLSLAPKCEQAGMRDEWLPFLQRGIELCRRFDDTATAAYLNYHLGLLHQLRNRLDSAHDALRQSASLFALVGESPNQARSLNRLAYIATMQHDYDRSKKLVNEAMALLPNEDIGREFSLFVLGMIALNSHQINEAVAYLEESLALCEQAGDLRQTALRFGNLGTALRKDGQIARSIKCYEQAIELFEQAHDFVQLAVFKMNLGNIHRQNAEPLVALEHYQVAESIFVQAKDERHLAMLHLNMGIAHRSAQSWTLAESCFQQSLCFWQQFGIASLTINVLDEFGLLYLTQKRYSCASTLLHRAAKMLGEVPRNDSTDNLFRSVEEHIGLIRDSNSGM